MLKKDLVKEVAKRAGHTAPSVRQVFDAVEAVVGEAISAGKSVMLMGLGKLVTRRRGPRLARHMVSGERVTVPERNVVALKPSDGLMRAANA